MSYIQDEILKIRADQIHSKNHDNYRKNYMRQIIISIITVILTMSYCYGEEFACPHCSGVIEFEAKGLLKDVWNCPKCGYENYEGISTCVQCGYYRYRW